MEFLNAQFDHDKHIYPVNLVLQSSQSALDGYSAKDSGNYIIANLSFDPSASFHEYRIDFVPGHVLFYADGEIIGKMNTSSVPTEAGHMILTHWSNGNPLWSGGPPVQDSSMTVSYVKVCKIMD